MSGSGWKYETDIDKIMSYGADRRLILNYFLHAEKFDILRKLLESKYYEDIKRNADYLTRTSTYPASLSEEAKAFLSNMYDEWWAEAVSKRDLERIEKFKHPFWDKAKRETQRILFYESLSENDLKKMVGWHKLIGPKNPLIELVPDEKLPEVGSVRRDIGIISSDENPMFGWELAYQKAKSLTGDERDKYMKMYLDVEKTPEFWSQIRYENDEELVDYLSREQKLKFLPILIKNNSRSYRAFIQDNNFSDSEIREIIKEHSGNRFVRCYEETKQKEIDQIEEKNRREQEKLEFKRQRKEYWLDENGHLIIYFRVDWQEPLSKGDYFVILDKFVQSGLSASDFCHENKIDNKEGFILAHRRRCEEDEEYSQRSKEQNDDRIRKLYHVIAENIKESLKNFQALGSIINEKFANKMSIEKLTMFCDKIDEKATAPFLKQVARYYKSRLDEYQGTLSEEDLKKMLTNEEVNFITAGGTEKEYEFITFGEELPLDKMFTKRMTKLREHDPKFFNGIVSSKNPNTIEQKLKRYSYKFSKRQFLNENTQVLINNELQIVSKEEVNKALSFAGRNNIYPSTAAIRDIIRAIKLGNIKSLSTTESGEDE